MNYHWTPRKWPPVATWVSVDSSRTTGVRPYHQDFGYFELQECLASTITGSRAYQQVHQDDLLKSRQNGTGWTTSIKNSEEAQQGLCRSGCSHMTSRKVMTFHLHWNKQSSYMTSEHYPTTKWVQLLVLTNWFASLEYTKLQECVGKWCKYGSHGYSWLTSEHQLIFLEDYTQ